jgi:hypothetical protein
MTTNAMLLFFRKMEKATRRRGAEQFDNRYTVGDYFSNIRNELLPQNTAASWASRALKNSRHVIELGFRAGGSAPFGYRRMVVSSDGGPIRNHPIVAKCPPCRFRQ